MLVIRLAAGSHSLSDFINKKAGLVLNSDLEVLQTSFGNLNAVKGHECMA
jgi:hypothetical protein